MSVLTADELVAKGMRLSKLGHLVVYLYPSQEWMAVQVQMPFLRNAPMPTSTMSSKDRETPHG